MHFIALHSFSLHSTALECWSAERINRLRVILLYFLLVNLTRFFSGFLFLGWALFMKSVKSNEKFNLKNHATSQTKQSQGCWQFWNVHPRVPLYGMHTLEAYRHFRFNLGVGLWGGVPTVLECPRQRPVRDSYFISLSVSGVLWLMSPIWRTPKIWSKLRLLIGQELKMLASHWWRGLSDFF